MKIFFDMEFQEMEDSRIIPISIGAVREDDKEFYTQIFGLRANQMSPWVSENVGRHLEFSHLDVDGIPSITGWGPKFAAIQIENFCGASPEFWADYGAYDWVKLCQLFGTMMDLPKGWPMFVRDFQQLLDDVCIFEDIAEGTNDPVYDRADARMVLAQEGPKQDPATLHHALHDARHLKAQYDFIQSHLD